MDEPGLPGDLQEVQGRLQARPRPEPSPGHRARILAAVGDALAARREPWWRRREAWQTAAAAAAVLVLWANVAIFTLGQPFELPSDAGNGHALRARAEAIRTVVPQLSERDALRQALVLRAGVPAMSVPRGAGPAGEGSGLSYWKEVHAWALP
jgi:hypothetical protein